MGEEDLSAADECELRRRQAARDARVGQMLAMALIAGVALMALVFAAQSLLGHPGASVSGKVLLIPVLVVGMLALLVPSLWRSRMPQDRIELSLVERRDRRMLWYWPLEAGINVLIAIGFAGRPDFSHSDPLLLFGMPLIVVCTIVYQYRRASEDDIGHLIASKAQADGFLAAFFSMTGLMLVAWFAPSWLLRLTPLALTTTVTVAACSFALRA
ncbi:MAG: hypothetical protein JWM33_2273, partial [Caulobacteraceae bacterium]|nr:hypothetical protein [Caulobacteraceae bacterium]